MTKIQVTIQVLEMEEEGMLTTYYKRLFPAEEICKWLTYGHDPDIADDKNNDRDNLAKREFSFTFDFAGATGFAAYLRWKCFRNATALRAGLLDKVPNGINIGAIYNHPVKAKGTGLDLVPKSREFVIDIDLTAYDSVRNCCSGKTMCNKCWPLVSAAIEVLDEFFRETMDFKFILWVYSGRRGVHCWICDKRAREYNNNERAKLIMMMNLFTVPDPVVTLHGPHPTVESMIDRLRPRFEERLKEQNLFADNRIAECLLSAVPNEAIRASMLKCEWKDGISAWNELQRQVEAACAGRQKSKLRYACDGVIVKAMGPRLDCNVSTEMGHLIRCPFSVNPNTGQICVPFDPAKPFDPFKVPTLSQVFTEIDRGDNTTSIEPYLKYFKEVFLQGTVFPCIAKGEDKVQPRIIKFIGEKE